MISYPTSIQDINTLLDKHDTWILDLDGTVWHARHPLPGVKKTIELLRKRNKKIIFLTNNPLSRAELLKWFAFADIHADPEDIYSPSIAIALYLRDKLQLKTDQRVYLLGVESMGQELDIQGINYTGCIDAKEYEPVPHTEYSSITADPSVRAVICTHDTGLSYRKLAQACRYLQENKDCVLIGSSADARFKDTSGFFYPGPASSLDPIMATTMKTPVIMGKPEPAMLEMIINSHGNIDTSKTIMVGDTLTSDIGFGKAGGLATLLVYTGVTNKEDLESAPQNLLPDYILDCFGDIAKVEDELP